MLYPPQGDSDSHPPGRQAAAAAAEVVPIFATCADRTGRTNMGNRYRSFQSL